MRRSLSMAARRKSVGMLMVLPALAVTFVFFMYPMILTFRFSFTDWNGLSMKASYVGWKNFIRVFSDESVKQVMFNTFFLVIVYVPVLNILALLASVLVFGVRKAGNLYKAVLFLPNMLSMTVIAFVWKIIYAYDGGLINNVLGALSLKGLQQDWLGQKATVLPALSLTIIWFAVGYYSVVYLAGLSAIPIELYEAAEVDGINVFQKFFRITLPLIAQAITINVILSMIGILSLFDLPFVMTKGGPGYYSETLAMRIYTYAYSELRIDYALAMAVFLGVVSIIITVLLLLFFRRREVAL